MSVPAPKVGGVRQDPEALLDELDDDQRAVATSLDAPVVVIAGAGSGKTRAITHRIAYAALTGVQSPSAVLAVTFTVRAAGEMKARLRRLGVPQVQARTFHSAALRQARYFWPQVNGVELPPIEANTLSHVAAAAARVHLQPDIALLRDLAGEISWAKVTNVAPARYAELAPAHGRRVNDVEPDVVGRVLGEYELSKRRAGVIDFDDILLCTVGLLSEHAEVAEQVRSSYRHLVVDEFQDVSPLQRSLLGLWLGDSDDVCVVGDPNQAIHGFAGGDRRFLLDFATDFPRAQRIELARNYRSTPQILAGANRIIAGGRQVGVRLTPTRPAGPVIGTASCAGDADEAAKTARWLAEKHSDGLAWAELAVLYRINAQSPALEAALSEARIPYVVKGAERFWERPEVRAAVRALQGAETEEATDEPPDAQVAAVLTTLGWTPEAPSGAGRVRERWESWQALAELAAELTRQGAETFAEVVAGMVERASVEQVPTSDAVTLSTIHAAKGLEWRAVSLVGVHEGTMPFVLATSPEQLDEERRLLYVAMTRAQDELRLSYSWTRRGSDGRRGPSRFLDGVVAKGGAGSASGAGGGRVRKSAKAAKCRVCGKALDAGPELKLGRHLDCPADVDPALVDALKAWRLEAARAAGVPAYVVFTDATLIALAEARPTEEDALLSIRGIGTHKLELYGAQVLAVIKQNP